MKTIIIGAAICGAVHRVAEQLASRGNEVEVISAQEAEKRGLNQLHPVSIPVKRITLEPIPVLETPDMSGREARRERRRFERKKC